MRIQFWFTLSSWTASRSELRFIFFSQELKCLFKQLESTESTRFVKAITIFYCKTVLFFFRSSYLEVFLEVYVLLVFVESNCSFRLFVCLFFRTHSALDRPDLRFTSTGAFRTRRSATSSASFTAMASQTSIPASPDSSLKNREELSLSCA